MNKPSDFEFLRLPADAHALEKARLFVLGHAERVALPPPKIFKLELALEEIVINVVSYAYPTERPEKISIGCATVDNILHIQIADTGKPFNPLIKETPDISQSIEDRAIGGLGIFLTREMVDDISYERTDKQNIITFSIKG